MSFELRFYEVKARPLCKVGKYVFMSLCLIKKKEKQAKQINLATKIQKNEKSTNHLHNYALCIVHYALPKHL